MDFAFVCLLALVLGNSPAPELFVAPGGNDRNPGSRAQPFRTLERARDAVRNMRSVPGRGFTGATVTLLSGVHFRDSSFVLTTEDGGTPEAPVCYQGVAGSAVRLSGGREISASAFHEVVSPQARRRIRPEALAHVLQADLRTLGILDYGRHRQYGHGLPIVPAPLELFLDDSVMPLARYPNSGAIALGEVIDGGSVPRVNDYGERGGRFRYTDSRHTLWAGTSDVWLQGFFHHGFADDRIAIAAIDTVRREVTLASPHMYGVASGEPFNEYVAFNLLEELDAPGEWYVDRQEGVLYFWPPVPLKGRRIAVSVVERPLLSFLNTSFVIVRNLTVECGRGVGIAIEGGEHITLSDCTVRNFGTVGVLLGQGARQTFPHITADEYAGVPVSGEVGSYHSHLYRNSAWDRHAGAGHTIARCEVYGTGSGGILLGGGNKKTLTPGGCTVTDCRIHDFDRRNKAGAAGVVVDGCGNRVVHSEIYNGDLQAIIVHGNDHLFEYNVIHHVARNSNDASAWYLGRDPSDQGNIVRWNFFHHVGRPDRKWTMGVYCDDATCDVLVEGNVFYKTASYGTVYSNGGHDIVVRNNIFIEGFGPAFQLKSMWYDFGIGEIPYFFGPKGIYTQRLTEAVDIRNPPYSTRYPRLRDWLDLLPDGTTFVGMRPRRNVVEGNVLVKHEETFRLVAKYAQTDFGENFITQSDPGFVDAAKMNFALKEDAEVYRRLPGFRPIPFAEMGPRKAPVVR